MRKPVIMGSYGIGSGRLLASIAEEHHDDFGLTWPVTVAPYHVHIVLLTGTDPGDRERKTAGQLYEALQSAGIEVLYDDRDESPGVKFNDADLIGLPIRLTVSQRSLGQNGAEFKRRDQKERIVIPLDQVVARIQSEIATLRDEIEKKVVKVPYTE
jgi:prolyl-tRNA synthetase